MKRTLLRAAIASLLLSALPTFAQTPQDPKGETGPGVPAFWVRPGYRVTLAAENFGSARFLEVDPNGTLYVSPANGDTLTTLRDTNNDGTYETKSTLLSGYPRLHGLHFADDGFLYFTTSGAIYRFKPVTGNNKPNVQTVIPDGDLPKDGGHWWRSIVVKDGYLWTSIGDAGNMSDQTATDRQKIWRYKIDPTTGVGSDKTLWCTGIRNTEKLRFRPSTNASSSNGSTSAELYGADHGSDNFGARYGEKGGGVITDVNPPCEFNHYIKGFNYGHPFVTGLGLPRPEHMSRPDILQLVENNTAPAWCFGAHNAPNGWTFTSTSKIVPAGDALVALHGSWNSTKKVGYAIQHITFDPATNEPYGAMPLVKTLINYGSTVLARPVDLLELPSGEILFSEDQNNKIYRITKTK